MFTMSLVGSSVKLETGKQIDTKTRQFPLYNIKKYAIFVSFTKSDYVRVIISGLGYRLSDILSHETRKDSPYLGRLYLMVQTLVRTNDCSHKESLSGSTKQRTR